MINNSIFILILEINNLNYYLKHQMENLLLFLLIKKHVLVNYRFLLEFL